MGWVVACGVMRLESRMFHVPYKYLKAKKEETRGEDFRKIPLETLVEETLGCCTSI